jgi:hypothetical protein
MKWEYQGLTPGNGKVYHKGRSIMVLYRDVIKLYKNPPIDNFIPALAECRIIRYSNGSVIEKQKEV